MGNPVSIIIEANNKTIASIFTTIRGFKQTNDWCFQKTFIINNNIVMFIKRCSGNAVTLQQSIVN